MEYSYHATELKTENIDGFKNVIVTFTGYLYGIDENGKNTTVIFEFDFDKTPLDEKSFIKYEEITEELVNDWLEKQMTEGEKKYLKQELNAKMAGFYTKAEKQNNPLPWS